jgi:hypothetical protein
VGGGRLQGDWIPPAQCPSKVRLRLLGIRHCDAIDGQVDGMKGRAQRIGQRRAGDGECGGRRSAHQAEDGRSRRRAVSPLGRLRRPGELLCNGRPKGGHRLGWRLEGRRGDDASKLLEELFVTGHCV